MYAIGVLTYSICIIVISCKIQLIEMHNKSYMAAISFVCSVGGWFMWNIVLSQVHQGSVIFNVKRTFLDHFGPRGGFSGRLWLWRDWARFFGGGSDAVGAGDASGAGLEAGTS